MVEGGTMNEPDTQLTMKEVSHTPTEGESVTHVWHRGDE